MFIVLIIERMTWTSNLTTTRFKLSYLKCWKLESVTSLWASSLPQDSFSPGDAELPRFLCRLLLLQLVTIKLRMESLVSLPLRTFSLSSHAMIDTDTLTRTSSDCSSKAAALSFHEGLTEELRYLYTPHSNARRIRTSVICPAHIKTPMFEGFASSIPSFLAPSLEVATVATLVTQTVLSGESQVSLSRSCEASRGVN